VSQNVLLRHYFYFRIWATCVYSAGQKFEPSFSLNLNAMYIRQCCYYKRSRSIEADIGDKND